MAITEQEFKVAANHLFQMAKGDHRASEVSANLILAWCNALGFGGFDFTDLWGFDPDNREIALTVITFLARTHCYFENFGFENEVQQVIKQWRPRKA